MGGRNCSSLFWWLGLMILYKHKDIYLLVARTFHVCVLGGISNMDKWSQAWTTKKINKLEGHAYLLSSDLWGWKKRFQPLGGFWKIFISWNNSQRQCVWCVWPLEMLVCVLGARFGRLLRGKGDPKCGFNIEKYS